MASSDDLGKDLDHVLILTKKFDDFLKDLVASEGRMVQVTDMAQVLLDNGHSEGDVIQSMVEVRQTLPLARGGVVPVCYQCADVTLVTNDNDSCSRRPKSSCLVSMATEASMYCRLFMFPTPYSRGVLFELLYCDCYC